MQRCQCWPAHHVKKTNQPNWHANRPNRLPPHTQVVKLHHDLEEQVHHDSQLMADNGARQVGDEGEGFGVQGRDCGWQLTTYYRGRERDKHD
jgi:hypothetical protein